MSAPVRLVLSGATGRMGTAVAELAREDPGLALVGGIGRFPTEDCDIGCPLVETPETAGAWIRDADVLVDFSAPELIGRLIDMHGAAFEGRALVIGTTGLAPEEQHRLDRLAERSAVLQAANFSVGVNLLLALAERAASVLDSDAWDAEIIEAHHRRKADAPSGTALALADAVASGRGLALDDVRVDGRSGHPGARPTGQIGLHAVRGGDIVGEHRLLFVSDRERIELAHIAQDRRLFAEGALRAARWIAGRSPGRYTLRDVLGLS